MLLKKSNYASNRGYYMSVDNGMLTLFSVTGNPLCTEYNLLVPADYVDPEWLKQEVLKLFDPRDWHLEKQTVKKRLDGEPYYMIESIYGFGGEVYTYTRINKREMPSYDY